MQLNYCMSPSDTIAGRVYQVHPTKPMHLLPIYRHHRKHDTLAPRKSRNVPAATNATCNAIIFAIDSHSKVFNAPTNVANASDIIFIATARGTMPPLMLQLQAAPMSRTVLTSCHYFTKGKRCTHKCRQRTNANHKSTPIDTSENN